MDNFYNLMGWDNQATAPVANLPMPDAAPWRNTPGIEGDMVLVMAYVKQQSWGDLYNEDKALSRGTIFPALDFPFMGEGGNSAR